MADRIDLLLKSAAECCEALGLRKDLIPDIYNVEGDWAFVLKVDALLEMATREVVKRHLKLERDGASLGAEALEQFVSDLPMNGRTSLMQLLEATGCDRDICEFVSATRKIRNTYAHDIRRADLSLLELVQSRGDWRELLKKISPIENYSEQEWVSIIQKEQGILRYAMLDYVLVFLTLSYHVALKNKPPHIDLQSNAS